MSVLRAGTDIGTLPELEVFPLVEAFRLGELERMLVLGAMGGTTDGISRSTPARSASSRGRCRRCSS